MQPKKIQITKEGYEKAKEELNNLYQNVRPKLVEQLRIAYDFGDLRENSEFDAAKDAMHLCEERIKNLESMLTHATIVKKEKTKYADLGDIVLVEFLEDHTQEEFELVSILEVSPEENKISNESPLGKAIYHSKAGQVLNVVMADQKYQIKILDIRNNQF